MTGPGARGPARVRPGLAGAPDRVDLLVVGLGVTGAGVALDAATRGLTVLAVDAHDLAFGTSRWSSKLVHGGLRYLAHGQLGVARESAVERGVLMETTAPHLTRSLPMLLPLTGGVSRRQATLAAAGLRAGDALRAVAGTSATTLPRTRRVTRDRALDLAPALRRSGLRGALLGWDGQLEDDARLVTCLARTAVAHGAVVRTRARVVSATGTGAVLRDERNGEVHRVSARAVVNATGVWAGSVSPEVRLKPSRGTHLVLRSATLPGLASALTVPVPGTTSRFVLVLPQPDGTVHVGLTDEETDGPLPDVPEPSEGEVDFLLDVVSTVLEVPVGRADVVGAYAGLRPLLDADGATADLSRRHAVLTSPTGVVTVVGGKLTTYRRMAEDAVDAVGLATAPCRTRTLPLLGAASRADLARLDAPPRLVRRFGTEAAFVLADAVEVTGLGEAELLAPGPQAVTLAELVFGVTHEGAADVDDLLDRRTRVGLVPEDRARALPMAQRALLLARREQGQAPPTGDPGPTS
ncbi:glycerol-3-phosphate dehydrogenase/oxidase [Nocardioides aurantiacus]|uniref:Glycerol-3-phosphate dehydrogenase n=1 Tax=Nocardioides aurantiacus TaxID=86796 RepID=A0A3N2CTI2_9ACTN|nr:glycerol-3-phosphate dehydrogenase/oxidase [Nocardioides aurantiacus]ROR90831.1 glycerol-3-phosphate dehydrogenase [Nocardioides aurantiacus]